MDKARLAYIQEALLHDGAERDAILSEIYRSTTSPTTIVTIVGFTADGRLKLRREYDGKSAWLSAEMFIRNYNEVGD